MQEVCVIIIMTFEFNSMHFICLYFGIAFKSFLNLREKSFSCAMGV